MSFQSSPKINRILITRLTLACGLTTEQINKTCQTVYYHLHNIRQIRKLLTPASTKRLVQGVIMARIYYCNGVLYLIVYQLCVFSNLLQRLQNSAARLITHTPRILSYYPSAACTALVTGEVPNLL